MDSDASGVWTEVIAELEQQLRVLSDWELEVEARSRTTMQCQRLLRHRWVALAVPARSVPRPDTDDPKGNFVIAFTDEGPWLFAASRSNPALPREPVGPIEDPAPLSFGPHPRDGGVLALGDRSFVVPYVYGASVRRLVEHLAGVHGPAESAHEAPEPEEEQETEEE